MILMLTADEDWNIGLKGKMLIDLKEDLKRFKEKTLGNIIVMGRNTLEALPGQKALAGRINIVMTRNESFKREGIVTVNSIEDLFETLKELNEDENKDVFVIGGASIVKQLLKYCDKAYITKILKVFKDHDTDIEDLDKDEDWIAVDESDTIEQDGIEYKYIEYKRRG